ncbi:hypothetical protein Lfu02_79500 [Longispora fulva]|uniref:Thiol-disulfide isomerase/thioredoxin n=1 Tax=Longispora fulva TaxID=619741 RepID=A0A8J7KDG3_9ACTN|nr:redoxin family protein [Longispora fulva]MBG6133995.1 thiol-disulfide isomerase/thioredoxin [Longispora fulva]GIG63578.1 hypothetical protein Lfu02_79500 [Longispora fulva]
MTSVLLAAGTALTAMCVLNLWLTLRLAAVVRDRLAAPGATPPASKPAGTALPAFDATTTAGRPVSGAELSSGEVAIGMFTSTCPPCVASLPPFRELAARLAAAGGRALAVVVDDHESAPQTAAQLAEVCDTVLVASTGPLLQAFGISAFPTFEHYSDGGLVVSSHTVEDLPRPVPA